MQFRQDCRGLDPNQVASLIMSGVWAQMDVRELTVEFYMEVTLPGVSVENAVRYSLLIRELMPEIVKKLRQQALLDSVQQNEFTQKPLRSSLAIPVAVAELQLNSPASFLARRPIKAGILCSPLLLVGVGIAMLAFAIVLQMILSEGQSLSSSPRFSP